MPADPEQPVKIVVLNRDGQPPYKALLDHVDGMIDVVGFDEGDIWVNDAGRLLTLPLNVRTSHWMLHESAAGLRASSANHSWSTETSSLLAVPMPSATRPPSHLSWSATFSPCVLTLTR